MLLRNPFCTPRSGQPADPTPLLLTLISGGSGVSTNMVTSTTRPANPITQPAPDPAEPHHVPSDLPPYTTQPRHDRYDSRGRPVAASPPPPQNRTAHLISPTDARVGKSLVSGDRPHGVVTSKLGSVSVVSGTLLARGPRRRSCASHMVTHLLRGGIRQDKTILRRCANPSRRRYSLRKQHKRPGLPPRDGGAIESPPTILVEPELNSRAAIKRRGREPKLRKGE